MERNHTANHCNHGSDRDDVDLAFASAKLDRWRDERAPGHRAL